MDYCWQVGRHFQRLSWDEQERLNNRFTKEFHEKINLACQVDNLQQQLAAVKTEEGKLKDEANSVKDESKI
jgi:uncharacterized protein (DUF3084 family)